MNKKLIIAMTMATAMLVTTTAQAGGNCPQPRKTKAAPANVAKLAIPGNADAAKGKSLYHKAAKPMACKMCHGEKATVPANWAKP